MECPSTINQTVCVEAKVNVSPEAHVGNVDVCCFDEPHVEPCCEDPSCCTYMVDQLIHIRFPLSFSAGVSVKPSGIVCDRPEIDAIPVSCDSMSCEHDEPPCEHDERPFKYKEQPGKNRERPLLLLLACMLKNRHRSN